MGDRNSHRPDGRPPHREHGPRRRDAEGETVRLFGFHTVEAALANPRRQIIRLIVTDNAARRLAEPIAGRSIACERATPRDLDRLLGPDTVHQGVLLETRSLPIPQLAELAKCTAEGRGPIVLLDQVTDPHNVGAILRSAAVFGSAGLVMTQRHSPPLDGTLAKAASGALEVVPVALVQNLARALSELGDLGVTRLGLDGEAEALIEDQPMSGPVALVLGAEGKGLRQLTREMCDRICAIAAPGPIASLNVSNAAAVSLHLAAMSRRKCGTAAAQ